MIADENAFRGRLRRFVRRKLRKLGRCRSCITSTAGLSAIGIVLAVTIQESFFHRLALTGALVFSGLLVAHGVAWIVRRIGPQPGM